MESREIFELRQITSVTLFVGLSVVGNLQMSVGRALIKTSEQRLGFKAAQAAGLMLIAALFSSVDAAVDVFLNAINIEEKNLLIFLLFLGGWVCNVVAVLIACISVQRFLPLLQRFLQASPDELVPSWSSSLADGQSNTGLE